MPPGDPRGWPPAGAQEGRPPPHPRFPGGHTQGLPCRVPSSQAQRLPLQTPTPALPEAVACLPAPRAMSTWGQGCRTGSGVPAGAAGGLLGGGGNDRGSLHGKHEDTHTGSPRESEVRSQESGSQWGGRVGACASCFVLGSAGGRGRNP